MAITKIKDAATAEQAARRLNEGVEVPATKPGEPPAPREKSTAEKLFPDFVTDDGGIINRPVKPFIDKNRPVPAEVTPAPVPQGQTPNPQAPTAPVYLKTDELTGKMVKIKVDGVEQDMPAESLVKNVQLERHLNAQLMTLAEERRKLEAERAALMRPPAPNPTPEPAKVPERKPAQSKTPEVEALEAQIAAMSAQMQGLVASLQPQIQDAGLKRVDGWVKERIGATDFMDYAPKIKEWALTEAAKYPVGSPQAMQFDSSDVWFAKYQEMKIKDMMAKANAPAPAPNPTAPVLQTPQGAPVILNNQGQPVSIPNIEPSGGASRSINPNGDWQVRAQEAFNLARQLGTTEAWMNYYRVKSEAQS